MDNKGFEVAKIAAVIEEIDGAYQLITGGIAELKKDSSPVLSNHVCLQLLSSGIERLVKIFLFLREKDQTGQFPSIAKGNFFSNYGNGHDIGAMLQELLKSSNEFELMQSSGIQAEIDFLANDSNCQKLIKILSDFGKWSRYFYIDTIAKDKSPETNCFSDFRALVFSFAIEGVTDQLSIKDEDRLLKDQVIVLVERTTRALARFFTHAFNGEGRKYYASFSTFLTLADADLGKSKYLVKIEPKRNPISSYSPAGIRVKLFGKSKKIVASQVREWPFTVDSVVVYNHNEGSHCLVEVGNEIFALNGTATSYYQIPLYFESKYLIPRKSCTDLMDFAKNL